LDKDGFFWIKDLSKGIWRVGSLMTVSRELSRYRLNLVRVQEVRWEGGGTISTGEYTFFYG
jgi:hypothetical protein